MMFRDRSDAGRQLAARLNHLAGRSPVVLALPRGGVPVAAESARALGAPLDLVLVRKIGVPWQPELALGAVADGAHPERFVDRDLVAALAVPEDYVASETARQLAEVERRRQAYCGDRPPLDIAGRTAIVVDDGIATGATMRVALEAARRRNPNWLVLAAPVAAPQPIARLRPLADEVVCVAMPDDLGAVGYYYRDFHQISDEEVTAILAGDGPVNAAPPEPEPRGS